MSGASPVRAPIPAAAGIDVVPLGGRGSLRRFVEVPWHVYGDDPAWVPPLRLERRLHFSRQNPYFRHAQWQGWIAERDGVPCGRVSAQIDELHRERYGPDTGHFGLLEGVDDPAVFAALIGAAEQWLHARGARRVTGPFSFSVNQECGLLVEGFEHPPAAMMPHARPWYAGHLEALGYRPARDLLAYWVNTDFDPPRVMRGLLARYRDRLIVRPLRRRRLAEELAILRALFNDAWSGNWGFVPFTEAEFAELGQIVRLLLPDDYVHIAELDGEPAAFIAALPNINEAIADLDGRLLPLGWLRLLWRLKVRGVATGRVPLMGVRREHQKSTLGSALAFSVIGAVKEALWRRGIEAVEMSWILEDNTGMRGILDAIGSTLYKRYRIYEKRLT